MLSLALPVEIYLCTQLTDLRRGFDRLAQSALEHAGREVTSGGLYVFINRRRDRVKLLYWDETLLRHIAPLFNIQNQQF